MSGLTKVLVVGASTGGLSAIEALRREGFKGQITLIGDERHLPYNRPPLSKQVLLNQWEMSDIQIVDQSRISELNVELRLSETAIALDLQARELRTDKEIYAWDAVIIATGSKPRLLPGVTGLRNLRTAEESFELRDALQKNSRIGIIGAGVLGSEIASAAVQRGSRPTIIGRSHSLSFGAIKDHLSPLLEKLHKKHEVELRLGVSLLQTTAENDLTRLDLDNGESIDVNFAISTIGSLPCTEWLTDSGLEIDDGIRCNSYGQAAPGVFAVGDVASWFSSEDRKWHRIEHQSAAIEQAQAVAAFLVGEVLPSPIIPFFWSEIHGAKIKAVGWFENGELSELTPEDTDSHLFVSVRKGLVQGAIAWNASPSEFRKARLLVSEYAAGNIQLETQEEK